MIHRRMFLAHSLSTAALCGAASEAGADHASYDLAADRFSRTLTAALSPAQYEQAHAHAVRAGWVDQPVPKLSALKARIAHDHRTGASRRVRGIRFSDTEIAWSVAYAVERAGA